MPCPVRSARLSSPPEPRAPPAELGGRPLCRNSRGFACRARPLPSAGRASELNRLPDSRSLFFLSPPASHLFLPPRLVTGAGCTAQPAQAVANVYFETCMRAAPRRRPPMRPPSSGAQNPCRPASRDCLCTRRGDFCLHRCGILFFWCGCAANSAGVPANMLQARRSFRPVWPQSLLAPPLAMAS